MPGLTTSVVRVPAGVDRKLPHTVKRPPQLRTSHNEINISAVTSTCAGWPCCDGGLDEQEFKFGKTWKLWRAAFVGIQCYLSMEF